MRTDVELAFGDGDYRFALGMAQIIAIEEKCGAGIGEVFSRVLQGRYGTVTESAGAPAEARFRFADLTEVIRQGLIGGARGIVDGVEVSVSDVRASHLVRTYVTGDNAAPMQKAWDLAAAVLGACIIGYEPAAAQKKTGRKPRATTGASSSPTRRRSTSSPRKSAN